MDDVRSIGFLMVLQPLSFVPFIGVDLNVGSVCGYGRGPGRGFVMVGGGS